MKKPFKRESDNYTLYGALFGFCFPVMATLLRLLQCGEECTPALMLRIQAADPLLWIIDSAPFWLGLFARFGGIRQDNVNFYAQRLEHLVEDRTRELNETNASMAKILHHVPIALFTINRDRTVNPGCSSFLSALLGGRKCDQGRFPDIFGTDDKAIASFEEWAAMAFDRMDLTWELLSELAPLAEIEMNAGESRRNLTVAYYPLLVNGRLAKIMVIMRDVTAEKRLQASLESERKRHDEDLSQISEIIRLDYDTFENFIFESRRIVAESARLLEGDALPRETVDELFRKIHTLKGNSLNFKFAQLSGMAHAVEDCLDEVRKGRAALTAEVLEALRGQITAVEEKLASIIGLAKSLTGGKDLGKVRDEGRDVFIRVKLDKILALAALADDLSKTGFLDAVRLRALSTDIGRAVAGLRRCSAERLFNRFPKMVKDLAASLNKEALMETAGGETEVDMDLLDSMGNALVHLVRNAVDHGLEPPADREASGKPRLGRVFLVLIRRPGFLVFTVADDGAGIRREKIIEKAVSQGLIPPSSAAAMTDEKVYELLCLPGFSTAEKVTDISGRGVGMDAVVNTVRKLSATLTFKSLPGQGSEFRIEVPENS